MLKEYRIKEGFTQEEMAELLNISWRHYQRIEIGKGTPSLETFIDIIEMCFHKKENLWYNLYQSKNTSTKLVIFIL